METYGHRVIVDGPFEHVLTEVLGCLATAHVDVVGRIDVTKYLKSRAHHDFRRYVILETLTPKPTFDALHADLAIGTILPTAIAIYELADGETAVVFGEPLAGIGVRADWRRDYPALAQVSDHLYRLFAHVADGVRQPAMAPS
jgi:uncharacterized protein (DUF302 family)